MLWFTYCDGPLVLGNSGINNDRYDVKTMTTKLFYAQGSWLVGALSPVNHKGLHQV